jgi:predicted dehydrogenase
MSQFRSVIIGCGSRGGMHAEAYKIISRTQLVACCDLIAERKQRLAETFGVKGYDDAAEMIAAEKPDLVHIVTQPDARVELMTLVSDAGVPACLVEKPIACEVTDWKALCELERRTKTKFAFNHQFRWHPHLTRCREAIRSGKLGKVLFFDFSAGMNISGQGTHIIDGAMSLNEDVPVVRVFGTASGAESLTSAHPGPDTTAGQVVFANGAYGLWNNGETAPRIDGEDAGFWRHCRVAAYCERGRTLYEEFGNWQIVSPDGTEGARTTEDEWLRGNHESQAGLVNAMADWLEDDDNPAATHFTAALHQWNAVLGLYASALYHRPIDIPFDPPDSMYGELAAALAGPTS